MSLLFESSVEIHGRARGEMHSYPLYSMSAFHRDHKPFFYHKTDEIPTAKEIVLYGNRHEV